MAGTSCWLNYLMQQEKLGSQLLMNKQSKFLVVLLRTCHSWDLRFGPPRSYASCRLRPSNSDCLVFQVGQVSTNKVVELREGVNVMLWVFPQFWCIVGWSLSCPVWGFHINYATNFQFIPGSEEKRCKILLLLVECTGRGGKGIWSCCAQGTMGTIGISNQCCTNRIHEWKASANNCALSWVSWLGCRMQAPLGEHCETEVVKPLSPLTTAI